MSYRHTCRVYKRYCSEGDCGLIHRSRGKASNRQTPAKIKQAVLKCYTQKYEDFGPTLAAEHLAQHDGYEINHETLRLWLLNAGLWQKKRRRKKHRRRRERKEYVGELVQMDGSPHDWFEGRAAPAVLMVMVDDASSRTYARFAEAETTRACMKTFWRYSELYGRPQALYVDRHSIYRCEREPTIEEQLKQTGPLTQFGRAMDTLGVKVIPAYSPQAKGRVERTNGIMQDRLIKEMRLAGVKSMEAGNRFLEESYLSKYNERFNVTPKREEDLHRGIEGINLDEVLCFEEQRQVQNDWTISWKKRVFQIVRSNAVRGLAKQKIIVREKLDGAIQLVYKGRNLEYEELCERPQRKTVKKAAASGKRGAMKPGANHPWRKRGVRS